MKKLFCTIFLIGLSVAGYSWPWTDYGCKQGDMVVIELLSGSSEYGVVYKVSDRGVELINGSAYGQKIKADSFYLKYKTFIPTAAISLIKVRLKSK